MGEKGRAGGAGPALSVSASRRPDGAGARRWFCRETGWGTG